MRQIHHDHTHHREAHGARDISDHTLQIATYAILAMLALMILIAIFGRYALN
jgi:TRAP-type C4-dicarboxylate transport system permease small subunit